MPRGGRHDAYSVSPRVEVTYMQAATPALIPRIPCYVDVHTDALRLISKWHDTARPYRTTRP